MKKFLLFSLLLPLCVLAFAFMYPQSQQPQTLDNIAVQFILTNGYGNNVYVDNFIIGTQYTNDVAVSSINIPPDSNYSVNGTLSFKILPVITLVNVGTATASSFNVVMTVGSYSSTKTVSSISSGSSLDVSMDSLTITPNTAMNIKAYSTWSSDQNRSNDTISQYTLYLPGAKRNMVYEAFTSSTCSPCASNNPYLDAFIAARFDTIIPIKYHVNWPSPGNDPMYAANPTQIATRISYYSISAVPTLVMDGIYTQVSGYSTTSNLLNPYNIRMAKGSPISLSVVDTKITGDSIKAVVTLTVISPLPSGTYKLRVESISRRITYASAPGSNGETDFKDVFRFGYPDMTGTTISTTPGTYTFEYRYKLTSMSSATDTIFYTAAFVQNDNTKEIINAAKSRHTEKGMDNYKPISGNVSMKPEPNPSYVLRSGKTIFGGHSDNITAGYNVEMFEGSSFPPTGWTIVNSDADLTWEAYSGANGPLIGGSKCTRVNCYSYSTTGAIDYLKSKTYSGLDLTDSLKFNWAHAVYTGYTERMQVQVSTNGGSSYPYTIFDKSGSDLATASATTSDFVPASANEWGRFSIALSSFIVAVNKIGTEVPTSYGLNQNYPNPFNPVTVISYSIPKTSKVSLKVYDLKGQLIETLFDGTQGVGNYITQFNGSKLASGVYFYRLVSDNFSETRKMVLTK
jgi:hypothetical protein